jgi:hypothetical protein
MTIRRTAYCHFENFFESIGEAEKRGCEEMIYIFSQPLGEALRIGPRILP